MRRGLQQLGDETCMQRVSGAISGKVPKNRLADQCKIAEQVEHLMTNKLIAKTQLRIIQHAGLGEHDCVIQRSAPNQTVHLQLLDVAVKAEGSRRCNEV